MSTSRRPWTVLAVAATMLAPFAPAARAEVVRDDRFTETYAYEYSDCGFPIRVDGEISIAANWRIGTGADASIHFYRDVVSFREVHTNPADGTWFEVSGQSTFREVDAKRIDGDIYEIKQVLAGPTTVIANSSGRVVARDRGSIHIRVLFDTGGDTDPDRQFAGFSGSRSTVHTTPTSVRRRVSWSASATRPSATSSVPSERPTR